MDCVVGMGFYEIFVIRWIIVMGMGFYKIFVIRCMSYIIVGDVWMDSYYSFFCFEFWDSLCCYYISIG